MIILHCRQDHIVKSEKEKYITSAYIYMKIRKKLVLFICKKKKLLLKVLHTNLKQALSMQQQASNKTAKGKKL